MRLRLFVAIFLQSYENSSAKLSMQIPPPRVIGIPLSGIPIC